MLDLVGTPLEEQIRLAPHPQVAKDLAYSAPGVVSNWDEIKNDIMYEACKAKFSTIPKLKALLLATGTAYLSEHGEKDKYWGDGCDDTGLNWLGKTLMRVRDELKAAEH